MEKDRHGKTRDYNSDMVDFYAFFPDEENLTTEREK
jgi:hypothetical protein